MSLGRKANLHNGIDRTSFLAETTINTFGHVNIIACCTSATVRTGLSLNGNGLHTEREGEGEGGERETETETETETDRDR